MAFPIDGEEEVFICAACEEPLQKGEEPYREGSKTYHGKCADKWRCTICGTWSDSWAIKCGGCGGER